MQKNHITQVAYSGSNQNVLDHIKYAKGYKSNEWLTFVQAMKLGRKVAKGEHGVRLMRLVERKNLKKNKVEKLIKGFTVFNLDQTVAN